MTWTWSSASRSGSLCWSAEPCSSMERPMRSPAIPASAKSTLGKRRMSDLLRVTDLYAGYAAARVLHGITLDMRSGEALALLGRNGVGKTTLLNSLVGLTRRTGGAIMLDGVDLTPLAPEYRVEAGIGWVPQERGVFKSLTVEENLTAVARPGRWDLK